MSAKTENTAERLRQLLLELYVSESVAVDDTAGAPEAEVERLLDTVLAAAEGRPFPDLGLPFPRTP